MGGSVRGGKIYGQYPASLRQEITNADARGRVLPTMPYEAVWQGISEWMGVQPENVGSILQNVGNFPAETLFTKDELFV